MSKQAAIESELLPLNFSPEEQTQVEDLKKTADWLRESPSKLEQYSGQYVAAKDCKIVAAADSYEELRRALNGKFGFFILSPHRRIKFMNS